MGDKGYGSKVNREPPAAGVPSCSSHKMDAKIWPNASLRRI
jgi:hypothetical protein